MITDVEFQKLNDLDVVVRFSVEISELVHIGSTRGRRFYFSSRQSLCFLILQLQPIPHNNSLGVGRWKPFDFDTV